MSLIAKLLNTPPNYRWRPTVSPGSVQVARVIAARAKYAMRPQSRSGGWDAYYDALDRDGIVVLPDFLPTDTFATVLAEYRAVRDGSIPHPRIGTTTAYGLSNWSAVLTPLDPAFAKTNAAIRNNPVIRDLASYVIRRQIKYFPSTMSILDQKLADSASTTTDGNTFLHADVHYHTVKAVLYLDDVTEGGAPFVFCYGSHRLSRDTVALEYELARRLANPRPGEVVNGYPIVGPELVKKYRLDPRPIYAPANTLIIADHAGFHARGPFKPGRTRATLRISFRFADARRYRMRWLFDSIRPPYEGFDPPKL